MKSVNERKQDERTRKRELGYVLMQIWVKPEWKAAIKEFLEKLKSGK